MANWYVAKSKPQKEAWLTTNLSSLGVEVFSPRIATYRRGKHVVEPLFPTYVFCRFDLNSPAWPAIRWSSGLSYFVGIDGMPSPVPDEIVDYLSQRVETWNSGASGLEHFHPGQRVTIANGPLAGLEGIFQSPVNAQQRCRILLDVVGGTTSVELDESELAVSMASV